MGRRAWRACQGRDSLLAHGEAYCAEAANALGIEIQTAMSCVCRTAFGVGETEAERFY
jgi:hypothetical protein